MDRKDLAGLKRMTVIPDGEAWRVVTLVSQTEIGPLGLVALGMDLTTCRGLSRSAAVTLAREIEAAMERTNPQARGRGKKI